MSSSGTSRRCCLPISRLIWRTISSTGLGVEPAPDLVHERGRRVVVNEVPGAGHQAEGGTGDEVAQRAGAVSRDPGVLGAPDDTDTNGDAAQAFSVLAEEPLVEISDLAVEGLLAFARGPRLHEQPEDVVAEAEMAGVLDVGAHDRLMDIGGQLAEQAGMVLDEPEER